MLRITRMFSFRPSRACGPTDHDARGPVQASFHPRACGAPFSTAPLITRVSLPSPRMRGAHTGRSSFPRLYPSIPAHAGRPMSRISAAPANSFHPRACGAPVSPRRHAAATQLPSPRMRGAQIDTGRAAGEIPSIPAHAGRPLVAAGPHAKHLFHPRACGAPSSTALILAGNPLPSPRMRGALAPPLPVSRIVPSIPAHAGRPLSEIGNGRTSTFHPRACGAPGLVYALAGYRPLPSPRMRGAQMMQAVTDEKLPSIPAHAGRPRNGCPPGDY